MNALEDFVEYLILGSVALLSLIFCAYVVSPLWIALLFAWAKDTPVSLALLPRSCFFSG